MQKSLSVLLVEDSEDDAMLLLRELRKGGYDPVYERVESEDTLKTALAARKWDLVLSDYVLPGFSGLDALRLLRESGSDMPFIVVSGKMGEETAVEVMQAGAHDYILKGRLARLLPAIERELLETEARRMAKKELFRSEEKYRAIFEGAPIGIFQSTLDGRFLSVNQSLTSLFGYDSPEQMVESIRDIPMQIFVKPDQRGELIRTALESSGFARREVAYRRTDGTLFIANLYMRAVRDDMGQVQFLEGFVEDITERKRAEEAFHAQFRQISTIFDELNVIVHVADAKTWSLVYLNKYGTSLFGDDWQGRGCDEVTGCNHPHPCPLIDGDGYGQGGDPNPQHIFEYKNSLTGRWYHCVEKRISWIDGRTVHVTVAVDITDLQDMMQMKDDLLSAVSHEMRTPLTAMCGYIDFLLDNEVDEVKTHEYLHIIQKENQRLNDLLSNFLSLQQLKAKKARPSIETGRPVALQPLIEEAVTLFKARAVSHRILLELSPDLPLVFIEEGQLHRILSNLLSNAIKYSPKGGDIIIGAVKGDDESVTVWVRDEGIGMPPEVLGKIFDRFYQVESGDRRTFTGAGLGLALVREMVTACGGKVRVESALGKGSTFFISLPTARR